MVDYIEQYYLQSDIKISTIYNYQACIKRFQLLLGKDYRIYEMTNPAQICDEFKIALNKIENINSKKTTTNNSIKVMSAYNTLLKNDNLTLLIKLLTDLYYTFAKKVDENKIYRAPTKKEIENKITWNDLKNVKNQFKESFDSERYLKINDIKYMLLT